MEAGGLIELGDELRDMVRLGSSAIVVGKPLPWSIFDKEGRLLMRKEAVLRNKNELGQLLERGAYRTGGSYIPPSLKHRRRSPFFLVGELMAQLNAVFHAIMEGQRDTILEPLHEVCITMQVMCAEDADAALAAIHLDKDGKYTLRHPIHSALLVELATYRLGYDPDHRQRLIAATLTANVGMLELQEFLQKQGPVNAEQRAEINQHPSRSVVLLRDAGVNDEEWLEIVLQHHERADGSGYPCGLRGEEIVSGARIIALADIYHAKISERAYRTPMLPTHALRQLFLSQGKDVDDRIAKAFIKELGVYPPGGFVRLFNGEIAVVTHRGLNGTAPRVASLFSPRGAPYPRPLPRDTSQTDIAIKESASRPESVLISNLLPLWGY